MISDRIKAVMSSVFGLSESQIGDDSSTDSIARWDSLGHLNLMIALENEFGISFGDEDFANLTSLPLLELEVRSKLGD